MIVTACVFFRSPGFRYPGLRLSLYSNCGGVKVVGVLLVLSVLMIQSEMVASSLETGSASQVSRRPATAGKLTVTNVRCGCGRMTQELQVQASDCTEADLRRGIRSKGEGHYPLKVKVRRNASAGSRIFVTWNLKSIPRKKQAKIKEFRLEFIRKSGKRRSVSLQRACFTVARPAKPKVCRRQVVCEASYPKRRHRNMNIHLLYAISSKRSKVAKFFQLKESLKRKKKKQRATKQKSEASEMKPRNRKNRSKRQHKDEIIVTSCKKWTPSSRLSVNKRNQVTLNYHPVNPFASKIEVTLISGLNSTEVIHHTSIPTNVTSYTFEQRLKPGVYSVLLRPFHVQNCRGVSPQKSSPVTIHSHHENRPPRSCNEWKPRVTVTSTDDGGLLVSYKHKNPFANTIELGLHEGNKDTILRNVPLPVDNTSYTFQNLVPGNYSISLRAVHPVNCRSFIPFRTLSVSVQDKTPHPLHKPQLEAWTQQQTQHDTFSGGSMDPVCASWDPSVHANGIVLEQGSIVRIEVSFTVPANLKADKIEVVLEDITNGMEFVDRKLINVNERNTYFNISGQNDKTYTAMVRPLGCRDCKDYTKYGDACNLAYHLSNVFKITNGLRPIIDQVHNTDSTGMKLFQDTTGNITRDGDDRNTSVTMTEETLHSLKSTASNEQLTVKPLPIVLIVSAVLIAAVTATAMLCYLIDHHSNRRQSHTHDDPEAPAEDNGAEALGGVEGEEAPGEDEGGKDSEQKSLMDGNSDSTCSETIVKQIERAAPIQETATPNTSHIIRDSGAHMPHATDYITDSEISHLPSYCTQIAYLESNAVEQFLDKRHYLNRTLVKQLVLDSDTTEVKS